MMTPIEEAVPREERIGVTLPKMVHSNFATDLQLKQTNRNPLHSV